MPKKLNNVPALINFFVVGLSTIGFASSAHAASWSWPLSNFGRGSVSQDYAEYGYVSQKYHSGFDIDTGGTHPDVHSVASGDVRKYVPNGAAGCNPQGGCTDHGVGNSLVIQQVGHVFSQYDHMESINQSLVDEIEAKGSGCKHVTGVDKYGAIRDEWDCKKGAVHVSSGQTIGVVGATAYGCDGCYVPVHLHLEAKHFDTLEAPRDHNAFGYSAEHPKTLKYLDPVRYLDGATVVSPSLHVQITSDGDGVSLRLGPTREYPAGLTASAGSVYWAHGSAPATSGCSMGWYKLEKSQEFNPDPNTYFDASGNGFYKLPDTWVCIGDGGTKYVVPI